MSKWGKTIRREDGFRVDPAKAQTTIAAAPEPEPDPDSSFTERVEKRGKLLRCVITQVNADGTRIEKASEWKERARFNMDYATLHRRQLDWLLSDRPLGGVSGR